MQKVKFIEHQLRMVRDSGTGGVGGGSMQQLQQSAFPIHTAFTSTATAALLAHYSTQCYAALFDKRRMQVNKPFGYAQEVEYKQLIHLLRERPSLLSFALAQFQWQLITAGAGGGGSSLDASTVSNHRKSMEHVSQCCVWDVFGNYAPTAQPNADAAGAPDAQQQRRVAYMVKMTMRIMWEKETHKIASERTRAGAPQPSPPAHSSSLPAPLLPLHLFDHNAFLPKLLHELNLFVGSEFLVRTLKDLIHIVLIYDDTMDLSQDLMAMMPSANGITAPAANTEENDMGMSTGARPGDVEMEGREGTNAAANMPTDADTAPAPSLNAFPPPLAPPAGASCSSSRSPPLLHGRSSGNLYSLCTTLLEKLEQNLDLMPLSMRSMAREMAKLCAKANAAAGVAGAESASAVSSPSRTSSASLLPHDPNFEHVSTRLLSDYLFLNWIVNALMFPEAYLNRLGGGNLTDNYPISPLAKRNLQAIGTVLIKLTSGSRFSSFSAHAQQQHASNGGNHSPSKSPFSSAAPSSRLDKFLEDHQPAVALWLRRVIDVPDEDASEAAEMERNHMQDTITIPASWKSNAPAASIGPAAAAAGAWLRHPVSHPPATLNPILMLPNDLFALHGLLKGCWNHAVGVRVASTPSKRKTAMLAGAPQPQPVPIAQLPLPAFPQCLREAGAISGGGLTPDVPYSLSHLTLLLNSLSSLGDVPNFVPPAENVYVLLDAAFPTLKMPPEFVALRRQWPFDCKPIRHAADILLRTLSQMPTLPTDEAHASKLTMQQIFKQCASQHTHALSPSLSPLLHSTYSILETHLPSVWQADSFRPFLLCVHQSLLAEYDVLQHSSSVGSKILLNYGTVERLREISASKEAALMAQFRAMQTKRLLELTRPKIRRLKKFLSAKTNATATPGATAAPALTPGVQSVCGGACPDHAAQDRYLCSACTKLLERRRGLLKSFMSKYVIGEGVVITSAPSPLHPSSSSAGGVATINAFAVPEPGSSPSSSNTLHVSVGVGPPLDLKDATVSSDIQDYILASAYPELFVRCEMADAQFYSHTSKLANMFGFNFIHFYVYMQIMDQMEDANKGLQVWNNWRQQFQQERRGGTRRESETFSSDLSDDSIFALGSDLGLEGHSPVFVMIPEKAGPGRSQGALKPREIRIPYVGSTTLFKAYGELRRLDSEVKPKNKLAACINARTILLSTLGTMSFSQLGAVSATQPAPQTGATPDPSRPSFGPESLKEPVAPYPASLEFGASHSSAPHISLRIARLAPFVSSVSVPAPVSFHPLSPSSSSGSVAVDEVEVGSVEDYMSCLCYLLLFSNPPFLLSNLHFLTALMPFQAKNCKACVDLFVAQKYLGGVWDSSKGAILAGEAAEQHKRESERKEAERRENMAREESELAAQAKRLSQQIQEVDSQQQQAQRARAPMPSMGGADADADAPAVQSSLAATSAYRRMAADAAAHEGGEARETPASDSPSPLSARLVAMGFSGSDVSAGAALLSDADAQSESGFLQLLDFLTLLTELVEEGYDKQAVIRTVKHATGISGLTRTKLVRAMAVNGVHSSKQ